VARKASRSAFEEWTGLKSVVWAADVAPIRFEPGLAEGVVLVKGKANATSSIMGTLLHGRAKEPDREGFKTRPIELTEFMVAGYAGRIGCGCGGGGGRKKPQVMSSPVPRRMTTHEESDQLTEWNSCGCVGRERMWVGWDDVRHEVEHLR
jgi:hypothetical protein